MSLITYRGLKALEVKMIRIKVNYSKIKELMKTNDDTIEILSEKLSVLQSELESNFANKTSIKVHTLSQIADLYDVPFTELIIEEKHGKK